MSHARGKRGAGTGGGSRQGPRAALRRGSDGRWYYPDDRGGLSDMFVFEKRGSYWFQVEYGGAPLRRGPDPKPRNKYGEIVLTEEVRRERKDPNSYSHPNTRRRNEQRKRVAAENRKPDEKPGGGGHWYFGRHRAE